MTGGAISPPQSDTDSDPRNAGSGGITPTHASAAAIAVTSRCYPLIIFAAGPGPITAVVTMAAVHTPDGFPVTAILNLRMIRSPAQ